MPDGKEKEVGGSGSEVAPAGGESPHGGEGTREEREWQEFVEKIEKQTEEARKFYEELWRAHDERKRVDYWAEFDKKMRARMPAKKIEVFDGEIMDLRKEIVKVYKRYKKLAEKIAKKVPKIAKILEKEKDFLRDFIKRGNKNTEILLAITFKVLLRLTTVAWRPRISKDLQRVYELARKLSLKTGDYSLLLTIFEGEALKGLGVRSVQKLIERMGFLDVRVVRVHYSSGRTFTKMYTSKKVVHKKFRNEEIRPKIPVSLAHEILGINEIQLKNGIKVVKGELTTIGSKDHFDYPFRTDLIGHLDEQRGKRIIRIELNRFLSSDESLTSFEYGEVA